MGVLLPQSGPAPERLRDRLPQGSPSSAFCPQPAVSASGRHCPHPSCAPTLPVGASRAPRETLGGGAGLHMLCPRGGEGRGEAHAGESLSGGEGGPGPRYHSASRVGAERLAAVTASHPAKGVGPREAFWRPFGNLSQKA